MVYRTVIGPLWYIMKNDNLTNNMPNNFLTIFKKVEKKLKKNFKKMEQFA